MSLTPEVRLVRYRPYVPYLFIAPMLLGLILFRLGPMLVSLAASFTDWNIISAPTWLGLRNYREMLSSAAFWEVLGNTSLYALFYVPGVMILGLALAVLVNQRLPGSTFFRGFFFLPYITSTVAVALVWKWIFATRFGLLNALLHAVGVDDPPSWLGDADYALVSVAVVAVWQHAGFQMLLFLAGLQNIDDGLREAARIDGATEFQIFRRITLPLLSPVTFFILIISLIASSQTFEVTYALTGGGPQRASTTLAFYIYQNAFVHFRMGYASALAYVLLTLVGTITLVNFALRRRWVSYG
ncbi:MAG: sugar ABC transporter permease [Trueperaceae bacterium]